MVICGLPDAAVKESRELVLASIKHFDLDVTSKTRRAV
jgi:magnesium chelatase family protein